ncbi:MAG: glutathione S-transferase [Pseudanabaenaceae cyanobacterium bins.39]|nr:glutathione S-transferase [Pseudanabaenaceae cyanobacterium bins.39]
MVAISPKLLRLYSFRRCPYAIRARMALAYAGISYELREVSLKNKPKEMLTISPKGTTPVLQIFIQEHNLESFIVLEESLDIMNWALDQQDSLGWRDLSDADLAIAHQCIHSNDTTFKKFLDRYKYPNRFPEQTQECYRQSAEEFLKLLESRLMTISGGDKFLFGDRHTLADIAIFPFIRQFAHVDLDWFYQSPYLHLQQWLSWHENSALFISVMQKFPVWESGQPAVVISA